MIKLRIFFLKKIKIFVSLSGALGPEKSKSRALDAGVCSVGTDGETILDRTAGVIAMATT